MQNNKLEQVNFAQKRRLAFINFLFLFKGAFSRGDLTNKFEQGMANATRGIALYRDLAGDSCEFDNPGKLYRQSKLFIPLFEHGARKTLVKLANNISDGFDANGDIQFPTAIEMDYGITDGVLNLNVRAALAGYLLIRWNVDCTENANLTGAEYQLYLQNQ